MNCGIQFQSPKIFTNTIHHHTSIQLWSHVKHGKQIKHIITFALTVAHISILMVHNNDYYCCCILCLWLLSIWFCSHSLLTLQEKQMIILQSINDTQYQVVLDTHELTYEEHAKLIRQRDLFPGQFVNTLIDLLPEDKTFDTYDHYNMVLNVKWRTLQSFNRLGR